MAKLKISKLPKTPLELDPFQISFITSNGSTSAAIDKDGRLWTWGTNSIGMLGMGHAVSTQRPGLILGDKTWISAVIGGNWIVALDNLSYAWAWGTNTNGELGNGTTQNSSSPVSVIGGRQWRQLETTGGTLNRVYGLDSLSYAYAWGQGGSGYNGDNTTQNRSSPTSVVGGIQWQRLYRASTAILGLDSLSYAWGWGVNSDGVLGNNTSSNQSSPVSVVGGRQWIYMQGFTSSAAVLALDSSSYAYCWGNNGFGQLGDGTNISKSSPVSVVGGRRFLPGSGFFSAQSMVMLDSNSYAWAWGLNTFGTCGDNTINDRSSPVSVVGGKQWRLIKNGAVTFALDTNSYAWAWGSGGSGLTGNGNDQSQSSPVSMLFNGRQIRTFGGFSGGFYAVDASSYLFAWGSNANGLLGQDDLINRSSPVSIGPVFTKKPAKPFGP